LKGPPADEQDRLVEGLDVPGEKRLDGPGIDEVVPGQAVEPEDLGAVEKLERVEAYEGQPEVPLKRLEGISEGLIQEPEVGDLPPLIDEDERVRHPLEEVGVEVPHLIHDRRTPQVAPLKELPDLRMAVAGG